MFKHFKSIKLNILFLSSLFSLIFCLSDVVSGCRKSSLPKDILDEIRINQFLYEFNKTIFETPGRLISNFNLTSLKVDTQRKRRSNFECDGDNGKSCCKKTLMINLHKAGFKFVVSPVTIDIGNCVGSCILNDNQFPNAKLLRKAGIITKEKSSCCFPDIFERKEFIIYINDEGIYEKVFDHLFVKTCRCT
uniref:TGF_BETA_2 domain-containing protein n=1 Tax=Parastrongyloides trichosuri TaxID=131310 RepID=A0A0N4ZHM3_PARTI